MSDSVPERRFVTPEQPGVLIDVRSAFRLVLALLALWNAFSGISLALFQGLSSVTLGGALHDEAAQRLLGVHVLVLAGVYGFMAWDPERLRRLLWLPYAHQFGIAVATAYDLLRRNRDFQDGAVPLVVAVIFLALLLYLLIRAQEAAALVGEGGVEPVASRTPGQPEAPAAETHLNDQAQPPSATP